jgi:anti-anti-sigma factor
VRSGLSPQLAAEETSTLNQLPPDIRVERPAADTAVAVFHGEHDIASRKELKSLLETLVDENDLVVLDFSEATFVDSTTMHLLVSAHAAAEVRGKTLRLQIGSADIVRRAFELTGVMTRLDCVASREDALRRNHGTDS